MALPPCRPAVGADLLPLGLDRAVPVVVQDVVVTDEVTTEADDATLERLAELTERYCVVGQSMATPPRIVVKPTP